MGIVPIFAQPYFVIGVILILLITLYSDVIKPAIAFLFAVIILLIGGSIIPADILEGLSNEAVISIVLLILITAGFRSNFNIERYLDLIFNRTKTYHQFLSVMLAKVALLSSFVNNTPVVALMTPYVFNWGKKNNISPSKLLIPLSYATIVGGMVTLIGTSTTLVLNGFLIKNNLEPINVYNLFLIGISVSIICLIFLILFSDKLLPTRQDLIEKFEIDRREYLIEKRLHNKSELIGKTVKDGGLRSLKGVYLVEIIRNEQTISPVNPNEIVNAHDILIFAGNTDTIIDLSLSELGIELPPNLKPSSGKDIEVVEVVISTNNSLIGKTIKESNFRERYDAAVVAIHRNGERLSGKLGRIRLKAGDVLLLYAGKSFINKLGVFKDLYLISGDSLELKPEQHVIKPILIFSTIFILLVSQYYNLFTSLLIISVMMVGMKIITIQNVKRDLDLNMIIILVLSLTIGEAMIKSGGAVMLADLILNTVQSYGSTAVLVGLVLITASLTSIITNIGAVSIAFPLAYAITSNLGISGEPFYLGIAFAASAAFISPIGYQTNLIVYGPGGYNFKDFLKIGFPMTIIYLTVVVFGLMILYPETF